MCDTMSYIFFSSRRRNTRLQGDWSSDVCSSNLTRVRIPSPDDVRGHYLVRETLETQAAKLFATVASPAERLGLQKKIGRASCRERGKISVVAVSLNKKNNTYTT